MDHLQHLRRIEEVDRRKSLDLRFVSDGSSVSVVVRRLLGDAMTLNVVVKVVGNINNQLL